MISSQSEKKQLLKENEVHGVSSALEDQEDEEEN